MGTSIKTLILDSKIQIEIIQQCIAEIKQNNNNVSIIMERSFIEAMIKLGEAQTFFLLDNPRFTDLKTLKQEENPTFTVIQGFILYRNRLLHQYPYERYKSNTAYFTDAMQFAEKYLARFITKLEQILVNDNEEIELPVTKAFVNPVMNERKYSIGDYLLYALREIVLLKKFLQDSNVKCFTVKQLFNDDNSLINLEAARTSFHDNVAQKTNMFYAFENFIINICSFFKEYNVLYSELAAAEEVSTFQFLEDEEKSLVDDVYTEAYSFLIKGSSELYKASAHEFTMDTGEINYHEVIACVLHLSDRYLPELIKRCNRNEILKVSINNIVTNEKLIEALKETEDKFPIVKRAAAAAAQPTVEEIAPLAKKAKTTDEQSQKPDTEAKTDKNTEAEILKEGASNSQTFQM